MCIQRGIFIQFSFSPAHSLYIVSLFADVCPQGAFLSGVFRFCVLFLLKIGSYLCPLFITPLYINPFIFLLVLSSGGSGGLASCSGSVRGACINNYSFFLQIPFKVLTTEGKKNKCASLLVFFVLFCLFARDQVGLFIFSPNFKKKIRF